MDDAHKSGRPFGCFFWVINADIELVSYDFISSNIRLIKIEANKRLITIIGVYCIYNNNTSEHFQINDNQLEIISSLSEQLDEENNDYVLLGDFNGDPYRNTHSFDKRLILFIANNNLLYCYSAKSHDFTFSNSISNSCIDHIFIN